MNGYHAYGLLLHSTILLPELECAGIGRSADVNISTGFVEEPAESEQRAGFRVQATHDEATLHWNGVGTFRVRNGCEIVVDPAEEAEPAFVRSFILGACMGVLLHQRGLLVLHASAVSIGGRAVAFIAPKGWGKSTTAATFHARGHSLITDDVLGIEQGGSSAPLVRPGFAQLKLWPDAVAASFGEDPEDLPRLNPHLEKRLKELPAPRHGLVPLSCIFVLDGGPALAIEPLSAAQGVIELLRHSHAPRFVGAAGTPPAHLKRCSDLAASVPIFSLKRRPDLNALQEIAALVEEHVHSLA